MSLCKFYNENLTMFHPFKQPHYPLNSCILREFASAEATQVADTLAQMPPWQTLNYSAETLANYLRRPDPVLSKFVITVDEQIEGTVCIRYPCLRGAYLELLAIYPSQQGRGIGQQVIQWLAAEAQQASSRNLWTLVSAFNHAGQRFYQKMGFTQVGQLDDLVVPGQTELLMRKMLLG